MAEQRIGVVYNIPPEPPKQENTKWFPAGAITIGVEYRDLNPESLLELYKDNPDHLKEMLEKSPDGGFTDEGVSIHVKGTADDHEYLRFDVFDGEPHYHYVFNSPGEIVNNVVVFDTLAHGEMLPFAIHCLRHRLPEMLPRAMGGHLVGELDPVLINRTVDEVQALAQKALADVRSQSSVGAR
jgi:hypothetical protein